MTRETVQIVELLQPFCSLTYGVAPCTATLSAGSECFNTRATCQDTPNFTRTTLSLFFSKGDLAEREVSGAEYIIPALISVSTTPTKINLAGASPDASGLGNRAVCTLVFSDHPHSDLRVDPYVSTRAYNPMTRGSFWTKWLARNKYRQNMVIRVYEGYAGQALSAMVKRTYFAQSITGPDDSGRVTIQGKDILARIEDRKAQAPAASPGKLYAAITAGATLIEAANATDADYPASGTLRIGSELITYSSRANSANGVTFTISARGSDNTTAATHAADDAVQICLRFTDAALDDVLQTLLQDYGGIDAAYLDLAGWAAEVASYGSAYRLNNLITEPTSVTDLVSQLQINAAAYVWWDERLAKVALKFIRGLDAEPPVLTDQFHILAGSFALSEKPRERASQVWVYYNRRDFIKSQSDISAYEQVSIAANLESEGAELYGEPSIRKVPAPWLSSAALANTTGSKIITRYVDVPSICKFKLDAKDRDYWVGDTVTISHYLDVDAAGEYRLRNWTIVSAEEVVPGEVVEYEAEDTTLYGKIAFIMASGAADYPGAASAPFKSAYIGNASGLLSDGANSARIN